MNPVNNLKGAEVKNGLIYFNGQPFKNVLAYRVLDMIRRGFININPLLKFINNLMQNPIASAKEELYLFMEANELPVTEDGHFLAYRRVRGDYMDIYTGTKRNQIGDVVSEDDVDTDRNTLCGRGIHACSRSYLPNYGTGPGNRTMIVKINPADVRCVPSDYSNAKLRCTKLLVVGEHHEGDGVSAFTSPVYNKDGYAPKSPSPKRDSKGRFCK